MAAKKAASKKTAEKTPAVTTLEYDAENNTYFLVKGRSKTDVGRSKRYAEKLLADANA